MFLRTEKYSYLFPMSAVDRRSFYSNVPLLLTNDYKIAFCYNGAVLWNSLPDNVRQAESLGQFQGLIKQTPYGTAYSQFCILYSLPSNFYREYIKITIPCHCSLSVGY